MEAGRATLVDGTVRKLDLIDAIVRRRERERLRRGHPPHRGERLPDLRLLFRHVHRQLDELPRPRPSASPCPATARCWPPTPPARRSTRTPRRTVVEHHPALLRAGRRVRSCPATSPPAPPSRTPWPSTSPWAAPPTRSCTCWPPPRRPTSTSASTDIDAVSRRVPCLAKVAPERRPRRARTTWRTCTAPAASPPSSASCTARGLLNEDVHSVHSAVARRTGWRPGTCAAAPRPPEAVELWHAAPGCVRSAEAFSQSERWETLDTDAAGGCIRDAEHAYSKDGGLAVLKGNLAVDGCVVKTAGVDESIWTFEGPAVVCESQDEAVEKILAQADQGGRRRRHPLRGPQGRPRHAGDALPDVVPEGPRPGQGLRPDHRRPLLRRHLGPVHRPRLPGGGLRRHHRPRRGRRPHPHRHPGPLDRAPGRRRRAGRPPRRPSAACTRPKTASARSPRRCGRTRRWRPAPTRARCGTCPSWAEAHGSAVRAAPARGRGPRAVPRGCRPSAPVTVPPGPSRSGRVTSRPGPSRPRAKTVPSGAPAYTWPPREHGRGQRGGDTCRSSAPSRGGVCPRSRRVRASTAEQPSVGRGEVHVPSVGGREPSPGSPPSPAATAASPPPCRRPPANRPRP